MHRTRHLVLRKRSLCLRIWLPLVILPRGEMLGYWEWAWYLKQSFFKEADTLPASSPPHSAWQTDGLRRHSAVLYAALVPSRLSPSIRSYASKTPSRLSDSPCMRKCVLGCSLCCLEGRFISNTSCTRAHPHGQLHGVTVFWLNTWNVKDK